MPTQFDAMDAALSAAVGDVFGEVAVIIPQIRGQYTEGGPDPARPAQTVRGIYSSGPTLDRVMDGRNAAQTGHMRAGQTASLWLDAAEAARFPLGLRIGDIVTFPGRGGLRMRISAPAITDMGDIEIFLNAEDAE